VTSTELVEVTGKSPADPDAVWRIAQNFANGWHPAIESMSAESDDSGRLIRVFTVHGEETEYRERLTYFSHSDRTLRYTHLQGIQDVEHYNASLCIAADDAGGSHIIWSAEIVAESARAKAIATGTHFIFETGISALSDLAKSAERMTINEITNPSYAAYETQQVAGLPELTISKTPVKSGSLCLFLHGIGGNRSNWFGQLDHVGTAMCAAALDLRGYGDSKLGPYQSTVDDYCNDILRVCNVLKVEKLVLCGLSYGAWIATSFAQRYPEKLAGLVLSGGCTGMSEASVEERESFRSSREVPLNAGQVPADFAPAVVDVIAGPTASEQVREQLLSSMSGIDANTYRDALTCFTNPPERFDFSRLTMPVLFMTGEHDRLAPAAEIRRVAKRVADNAQPADVQFEIIPDAGHVCNLENPQQYNLHLSVFVQKVLS